MGKREEAAQERKSFLINKLGLFGQFHIVHHTQTGINQ